MISLLYPYIFKANKKGPEFETTYNNTEQKILVHFTTLEVLLHQEALLSIMDFAKVIWAVTREKVPYGLSRCHTKRRAAAAPLARPSFSMTTTQDISYLFAKRSLFIKDIS